MSLAENLLNSLSSDAIIAQAVDEEPHIIVNKQRQIIVPNELKTIAVTGDKDVETVTIDCIRYWDNHDFAKFALYINYVLPNGDNGTYIPQNIEVNDDTISFTWTIGNEITVKSGKLMFSIEAVQTDENANVLYQWGSLVNSDMVIPDGLSRGEIPDEDITSDIVAQVLQSANRANEAADLAEEAADRVEETAQTVETAVVLKQTLTVKLGEELLTNDAILGAGWSGTNESGYTHTSGNDDVLQFEGDGIIGIGEEYICEFNTTYTGEEFIEVGIGNAYKILVYNGTSHIVLPLKAIDGVDLYFKPYKNINFKIYNLSLKRISDNGEPKTLTVHNTLHNSNNINHGYWNVVIGNETMENSVGSTRCIAIGNYALKDLQGGHRNIAIGTYAMTDLIGGNMNVAIGADSMFEVKEAKNCIAIGKGAMHSGKKLSNNIAIGFGTMAGGINSNADLNIAIGMNASFSLGASASSTNENTSRNICIGYETANGLKLGIANIYLGDQCTAANGMNQNIVIGASAKAKGEANRSIAIGYQAETTKANQAVFGGDNVTETVLKGDLKVKGTDGVLRQIIFNTDGTVTWEAVSN